MPLSGYSRGMAGKTRNQSPGLPHTTKEGLTLHGGVPMGLVKRRRTNVNVLLLQELQSVPR